MSGFYDPAFYQPAPPADGARIAADAIPLPKTFLGTVQTVLSKSLIPTDLMTVSGQGATPETILLHASGSCPLPTGEAFSVALPYLSMKMFDSFNLPIPGSPAYGDSVRAGYSSRNSSRYIHARVGMKQKRNAHVTEVVAGTATRIGHYGTYAYVDEYGVTHQPPGVRDPVVNRPQVNVKPDYGSIKVNDNNELYADLFGTSSPTSAAGAGAGSLAEGHAVEILPGVPPSEGPSLAITAGGSMPIGAWTWAYCWLVQGKRTALSPIVSGTTAAAKAPNPAYQTPTITIPGLPVGSKVTQGELYRKDGRVSATGTVHTKFSYASTPTGAVLISDASTGATKVALGAYAGMWEWIAPSTTQNAVQGNVFYYNPGAYVMASSPPLPLDPRDNSVTTFAAMGGASGESAFATKDGGALNPVTGDITFPRDNVNNHSGYRLVQAYTASPDPQDIVDTYADGGSGTLYVQSKTTINVKPARYLLAPFSGMTAIPGTNPPLYELSGFGFSSADPAVSNDGGYVRTNHGTILSATNDVELLLAAGGTQRAGWSKQTVVLPGYDPATPVRNHSGMRFGGDNARGARISPAAYQTLSAPSVPISQAVSWLQEPETASTKKLKSGLRFDQGDSKDQVAVDQAMQTIKGQRVPMGLLVGIGDDGNAVGAYPDMGTIDYDDNGALRAKAAQSVGLPPPTTIVSPPAVTGNPPGTVCQNPVTAPDGTVTQSCVTTTTGPPPPGTGTGDQYAPPATIPNPSPSPSGSGSAGTPGYDCSAGAVVNVPLGAITNVSGSANLLGPAGFTQYSNTFEDLRVNVATAVPFAGIWIQGHITLGPTYPYYSWRFGLDTGFAPSFLYNIIGFGINNNAGGGARTWSLINGNAVVTSCTSNPADAYFGMWITCDRYLRCYLGSSETEFIFQGEIPYRFVSDIANWEFTSDGTNLHPGGGAEQKFLTVDHLLAYSGQPSGVTLKNPDGTIIHASDGTTIANPNPGDSSGLTPVNSSTTTTTVQPSATGGAVSVALLNAQQLAINGDPANAVIGGADIVGGQWGMLPNGTGVITDVKTGTQYAIPTQLLPSGQPGAIGAGGLWPGA